MLDRTIKPNIALIVMTAVAVAQNRADAERLRAEAEDARSRAAALERRAESLERTAADAERKLADNTAVAVDESSVIVQPLEPYAISPRQAAKLEDCGVTLIYDRLRRGEYEAVKDGHRTKILFTSIKRRRATLLLPHAENRSAVPTRWRRHSKPEANISK
jgi:hypothetical protein